MKRFFLYPILVGASLLLASCEKTTPSESRVAPPPPQVAVITVRSGTVPLSREFVGRLAPTRIAEVRARVAGIILKRVYREGTDVAPGEVLFQIDPAPLGAVLHAREAALAQAQADAANAAAIARRYRELAKKGLISTQDLDSGLATERSTAAAVKQALANVESARLDLGYATVTAPIEGRAGRALVTEGALVGQGEATQLTRIEQIDPVFVNFSLSVAEMRELRGGSKDQEAAQVEVLLSEGEVYPHSGTLDFSDLAVDPGTGAVSLRAVLPNPERSLLPGMFLNLKLNTGVVDDAYVLPQSAVARDAGGAYVLVVDAESRVVQRRLQIHGMTRGGWIVRGDLGQGERMIVEGLQKVQPGGTATPVPAATPVADTAAK
ncbi:MAG: efflux RND transporter periplasmic adaptor subunit [Methylococcales bacterium]